MMMHRFVRSRLTATRLGARASALARTALDRSRGRYAVAQWSDVVVHVMSLHNVHE